jgi:hypothetical protein
VRPNIDLVAGTGISTGQGIQVDRRMQTNDPHVYAAGDVAEGIDFSTGGYSVQAIQPTAADHGQLAARNMAGLADASHRGSVNMNVLDTLGLISSSFGLWMGKDGDSAEVLTRDRFRYLNLQFEDDVLIGATSLGLTQHVGVLRGLIQTRTRLGAWKAKLQQDPTRIMEAYLARTQAVGFNAGVRRGAGPTAAPPVRTTRRRPATMQITLKLFVSLAPFLPRDAVRNAATIEVDEGDSVHAIIDRYRVPRESAHLILINGAYVQPADRDRPIFQPGDVLAMWPPVAGG